ncbi:MAG: type II toxin-antitoxin system ParD family antitoxin [Sneathiellaceae bacterium]
MPRTSRPITVTLGDLQDKVEERVRAGGYASASEVLRAALRALDREEAALDDWMRRQVDDALADPRPDLPAEEVFADLRRRHAARLKKLPDETA